MADYPGAIKSFNTQTAKEDLATAAFVNSITGEITAIQTELGINVAGIKTDLLTKSMELFFLKPHSF